MSTVVNDSNVTGIINQALSAQGNKPGETIVHRTSRAFRQLQSRRRHLEPLNIDLAAAEHYMYARFLAGMTGDPAVRMAPTLYDLKKRLYFFLGIEERMATTHHPVLPPNQAVERWGIQGVEEGLRDYEATHGMPAKNYGKALSALAQEAKRYN